VAVDTYRHFGKAAEACCITQPTLSMQIKKLEEDLEIIIFDRSRQPLIPTDVGQRLIEQARLVLKENNELYNIVKEHKNEFSGTLRIGIIPTLAPYLLPVFIGKYKKKYPNIFIIANPELWLLSDGHCFREQVINLCSFLGSVDSNLPFHFEAGSLETLMNIIDREGDYINT